MQLLTSTLVYENPWLTVREDTVRRGDGSEGLFAVVDAATTAARELREETGLTCASLTLLGTLDITPSTTSQRCRVWPPT